MAKYPIKKITVDVTDVRWEPFETALMRFLATRGLKIQMEEREGELVREDGSAYGGGLELIVRREFFTTEWWRRDLKRKQTNIIKKILQPAVERESPDTFHIDPSLWKYVFLRFGIGTPDQYMQDEEILIPANELRSCLAACDAGKFRIHWRQRAILCKLIAETETYELASRAVAKEKSDN